MRRFDYAWIILAAGFVVLFFSGGAGFAFGLTLKLMAEDLQWSRSSLSLVATVFLFVSAIVMVPVGRLVDRYGPRWIIATGAVASAIGIGLTGLVNSVWQLFLAYGVIYAIGHAATSIPAVAVMVSHWFKERRGIASGAVIAGNAVGRLVIISALTMSLSSIGWRMSYVSLGAALLVVILPLAVVVVRPRPPDDTPDGRDGLRTSLEPTLTIWPILRSRQLWFLVGIYAICGTQDYFIATHIVAFALDKGLGQVLAGNLLALMGVTGLIGVLGAGYLSDAFGAKYPTALCFVLRVAIFTSLIYVQGAISIPYLILLYGVTMPITAPLIVVFSSNIFGTARLGTVSGILNMVHQGFGGAGAILGALAFDRWGSYQSAFFLMLILTLAGIVVTSLIREKLAISEPAQA